ncbi:alpha/beta fold hydrolase [Thermoflexibacter ruber]|uniref:Pimeloyl-ACP methyl ester carboxylesterase n=1 Tax=Thermoflexibacter ruber TaxID=1003 RepID=A0A1I2AFG8_9BACT|nr:alpha/beta hydrolase [Thermoflexibacter ruber]SFE42612.1 Pimeloyl-ACP methyl ester carboxylesterase [Thermoflexibacter ruber]
MNAVKITFAFLFFALTINGFGQTNNYTFESNKSGKGKKAIIFIPGFACSGEVWSETKKEFENEYTCYTVTMAGFAGVKPQANASFKNWASSIVQFIKDNKIDKPILVGHSMGGGLAMAIASDFPDLLSKLIVVDALPCLQALSNPDFISKENNDCSPMISQMEGLTDEQFYQIQKQSIPQLVADTTKQDLVVRWSVQSDKKTFATMYCDFYNVDLREKIKAIKCPSLILLESYFVNIKPQIDAQYKNLKTANLQYANKGLHFIMYDDKDWYLSQLKTFITMK